MRRLLTAGLALVVGVAALVAAAGGQAGPATYRVNAVFDRTAALIPGQRVKVAGAPVGDVADIRLTRERKALVEMNVDEGFAPFRANARCTIRAEALIGEKFVQCDPGTPAARPLAEAEDGVPTVPLERTTVPVEIDTILSTFRRPYRERLRILLNEFGVGLAGRSDDLDAAIRRANPALREANKLLRILDREKRSLARLVEGSDAALAELAGRSGEVQSLIERADSVSQAMASRRGDLGESIRLLPRLLDEVEPSADRLSALAREATPAVRQLRAAAPDINDVLRDVAPLSDAAVPALERLGRTSRIGRRTVRAALPVARRLQSAARELPDVVRMTNDLLESLRDSGGVENLLTGIYYAAAASSRFDAISHVLPAFGIVNSCINYATTSDPTCDGHFAGGRTTAAARRQRRTPRGGSRRQAAKPRAPGAGRRAPQAGGRAPGGDSRPALPALPDLQGLLQGILEPLPRRPVPQRGEPGPDLLEYLLR